MYYELRKRGTRRRLESLLKKTSDRPQYKEFRRYGAFRGAGRLGAGVAVAAAFLMTTETANAQFFGFGQPYRGYGYGYGRYRPYADPFYFKPQPKHAVTPKKAKDKEATVKRPAGPLLITVSLHSQRLTLYA